MVDWQMGHIALLIWDAIPATKSYKGTGSGRLLGWTSKFKNEKTLWRSPRWDRWSLHDSNVFWRTSMATLLRRRIKKGSSRKYYSRTGGGTCLPTDLRNPSCILINRVVFQQCSRYNALLIGMQIVDDIGVKNLEAYGDSKLIVNQVRGSTKSDMKT